MISRPALIFFAGALLLTFSFLLTGHFAPDGLQRSKPIYQYLERAVFLLSAMACIFAPFFSNRSWIQRIFLSFLSTIAFAILVFLNVMLSLVLFGIPEMD